MKIKIFKNNVFIQDKNIKPCNLAKLNKETNFWEVELESNEIFELWSKIKKEKQFKNEEMYLIVYEDKILVAGEEIRNL